MSAVTDAMRAELQDVLKEELTTKSLAKLMRLATAAKEFLQAGDESGAEKLANEGRGGGILSISNDFAMSSGSPTTLNNETYGAKLVRELLTALPAVMRMQKETPEGLVRALAEAKAAGLDDVARQLEERLGVTRDTKPTVAEAPYDPPYPFPVPMGPPATPPPVVPGPPLTTTRDSPLFLPPGMTMSEAVELRPLAPPSGPPIEGTVRAVGVDVEAPAVGAVDLATVMGLGPIGSQR